VLTWNVRMVRCAESIGISASDNVMAFTDRPASFTRSRLRSSLRITERLSMPGAPLVESIRCRLFASLPVASASCSTPTVAFTRSRTTGQAVPGSPLGKSVSASSRRAFCESWPAFRTPHNRVPRTSRRYHPVHLIARDFARSMCTTLHPSPTDKRRRQPSSIRI
jgi:hypothetical protein